MAVGVAALVAQAPPQLGASPVRDVVAAMTREEKASLVVGVGMDMPGLPAEMQGPVAGQTSWKVPGAAGATAAVPRLGIPSIVLADGPAGVRIQPIRAEEPGRTYYCTAFPIASLIASTWDVAAAEAIGRAMGNEAREYGVDVVLGPALNTHRNPLGGRNYEYFSEDPLVSGLMAAAMVSGIQSQGVGTSPKHFVANDHEWNRDTIDVKVSQRALREIHLRGFELLVREAKPWTIMSSYNKLNGTYTSESAELLAGVLRGDWGFDGLVMSDWFGGRDAAAQLKAGNDLLMPGTARQKQAVLEALENGTLPEAALDRNVAAILDVITRTPAFKRHAPSNAPDLKAHAAVARAAGAEGMVLLRNDGALPFKAGAKLALAGNSSYATITGGTGSGDVNEAYSVALAEGLNAAGFEVDQDLARRYADYLAEAEKKRPQVGPFMPRPLPPELALGVEDAARLANDADAALVTIGRLSGEFVDRTREGDFELSATEKGIVRDLAAAFHAKGKKVVVVLNVGGVVETASWRDLPDAILLAWQPGQEAGHAIADVLAGRVPPSGRLATTFPMTWEDVPSSANFPGKVLLGPDPASTRGVLGGDRAAEVTYDDDIWVGYRHFAARGVKPAYPFGYGLSYTQFGYSNLRLSAEDSGKVVTVAVTVANTGKAAGREVVQLYLAAPGRRAAKPSLELRGFAKTALLKPGESATVTFRLTPRDLASFDEAASAWVAEAGTYTLKIGASSEDIRQTATFEQAREERVETVSGRVGPVR